MKTQRKILLTTRHGEKQSGEGQDKERITDKSVQSLYDKANEKFGNFIYDNDVDTENIGVRHTDKVRTITSVNAILNGIAGIGLPSREQLAKPMFGKAQYVEDPRLGYTGLAFNLEAIEAEGPDEYVKKWASKPNSTDYEGKKVTSFNEVIRRVRPCLSEAIKKLTTDKEVDPRILEMFSGHAGTTDAVLVAAMTKGDLPDTYDINQFGGGMKMEDNFMITLDKSGSGIYTVELSRNDEKYELNLADIAE